MKLRKRKWVKPGNFITMLVLVVLLSICKQTGTNQADVDKDTSETKIEAVAETENTTSQIVVDTEFTARDLEVGYEESTAVNITLNGDSGQISGNGATEKDGIITISTEGTYVISGNLNNGQILIDADDKDKVHIILAGMSVTSKNSAPIYIKNADKVFLTLKEGTQNTLTDSAEYVQSDENTVDGAIFSKADLTINGSGTLTVTGNYKHGILSKDDLVITGGNINVTAVKDALNGKDSVKIKDGNLILSATTGNGIQSKNDEDATKGYVYIAGGKITVVKCQEGIEGTVIRIDDGEIDITADDDGLNSANGMTNTEDNGNMKPGNKPEQMEPPEGFDPDSMPKPGSASDGMTGNQTDMPQPEDMPQGNPSEDENSEVKESTAEEADTTDVAKSTRPDGGNRGGFGGGNFGGMADFTPDPNCYISIGGGNIHINVSGDGIDSNGNVYISGGNLYVSGPTDNGNGAIDYNGTAEITGGTVIAAGNIGMAQGFSESSTQYSLLYNLSSVSKGGTEIKLADEQGNVIASFAPDKDYQSVVISCPDLEKDKTYTLTCGEQTAQITIDSIVTSNGNQGMGRPGGFGGL